VDEAERLFKSAEWWARTAHAKAVIAYDRATLLASQHRYEPAKAKLREAAALSRRSVAHYFQLSAYFADASQQDPEFKEIIK
jgi:hypothetical protein